MRLTAGRWILAVAALAWFLGYPWTQAVECHVLADFDTIREAAVLFRRHVGRFPIAMEELLRPAGVPGWNGPYLSREPLDPYGARYGIRTDRFAIVFFGDDGRPGGVGTASDVSSAEPPELWWKIAASRTPHLDWFVRLIPLAVVAMGLYSRQAAELARAPPAPRITIVACTMPERCSYCHGDLEAPSISCRRCATVVHADCWRDHGRCPVLGCSSSPIHARFSRL